MLASPFRIVGYNDLPGGGDVNRTGSHNLIVGTGNNYASFGGMVAGIFNTISGQYVSVSGGNDNAASGNFASVSGGINRSAPGPFDWRAGGLFQDF